MAAVHLGNGTEIGLHVNLYRRGIDCRMAMGIFESEQERSSEGGFSLLEVMLALPVELILCLAMLGIFNFYDLIWKFNYESY